MTASQLKVNEPIPNLSIGSIIEVDGSHIVAALNANLGELSRVFAGEVYPIGQFGSVIKIHFGRRIIYAFVGRLRMKAEYDLEHGVNSSASPDERIIEADLFGEGEWHLETGEPSPGWSLKFERGVSTYPLPQQTIYLTPKSELRFIYGHGKGPSVVLGEHVGSGGAPCHAEMNELLGKHTAILGSTGAGKSATVAAILQSLLARGADAEHLNWHPRIVVLDPHNEYGIAFPGHRRLSTDEDSLKLPYWLLDFQETIALMIGKTEFIATSQANIIKGALLDMRERAAATLRIAADRITIDSPIPYSLNGLIDIIQAQKNALTPSKQDSHNSILQKIETLRRDRRMKFMMQEWDGTTDPFPSILGQFVGDGDAMRIVDLSGVPNEVAGTASAAIARSLFLMKVWQSTQEREANPTLLVCEEAHRYVPDRGEAQYEAAQEAIRRIAKEGRKYGLGLFLVSQRPSEVEATVLSQCNSWIIHRITNESDRKHVQSVLPDSVAGLTKMLSGLRRREAIFVGQAAMLPTRILVRRLPKNKLPKSNDIDFDKGWQQLPMDDASLGIVAQRWRYQER